MDSNDIGQTEAFNALEDLVDSDPVGVLATVDENGLPHVRWMVAALVRGRPGFLYSVTAPDFAKVRHIEAQPRVEWMLSNKKRTTVLNVTGVMQAYRNPALQGEVQEALGGNLMTFWTLNQKTDDLLVLETVIEEMTLLDAGEGKSGHVRIS